MKTLDLVLTRIISGKFISSRSYYCSHQLFSNVSRWSNRSSESKFEMEEVDAKLRTDFLTTLKEPSYKDGCIFCKIARGEEPKTRILFQNEAAAVFHDIKPSTKEHLLIIPNSHHLPVKSLTKSHIPLLEYLHQVGAAVVEARGGDIAESRVGFHWPPFNTIEHLHLHVIYPANEMGLMGKIMFKPNFWFVTYDWALDYIRKKEDKSQEEKKVDAEESSKDSGTNI